MSFKTSMNEIKTVAASKWGLLVVFFWIVFLIFDFWDIIKMFQATRNLALYALLGIIDVLLLGTCILYFMRPQLSKKIKVSNENYHMGVAFLAFILQYLIAVIAASTRVSIVWTYFVVLMAEVFILICTKMMYREKLTSIISKARSS